MNFLVCFVLLWQNTWDWVFYKGKRVLCFHLESGKVRTQGDMSGRSLMQHHHMDIWKQQVALVEESKTNHWMVIAWEQLILRVTLLIVWNLTTPMIWAFISSEGGDTITWLSPSKLHLLKASSPLNTITFGNKPPACKPLDKLYPNHSSDQATCLYCMKAPEGFGKRLDYDTQLFQ
jgi:hypothetical protein